MFLTGDAHRAIPAMGVLILLLGLAAFGITSWNTQRVKDTLARSGQTNVEVHVNLWTFCLKDRQGFVWKSDQGHGTACAGSFLPTKVIFK
jgi:hypothetical protein